MKVRISYTAEVPDERRRAINLFLGRPGLATRDQVKDWIIASGLDGDDSVVEDMYEAIERGAVEPEPPWDTIED